MVRYFFLSVNVINSLLAIAVAAVVYFGVLPIWDPTARISLPTMKETATSPGEPTVLSQRFPITDYAVISDKNLFHPERKIPPEKQPEKVIPKPEVFLYGTLIAADTSYAFIEDRKAPYSTPGRGKRQLTLKKGDHLGGYILSEIEANRIVLVKGEEKVVVLLDDTGKRKADESSAGPATRRTDAGGIPPFPPAASSSPQAMPSPTPKVTSPGPGIAPPASRSLHRSLVPSLPQAAPSSAQTASPPPGSPGMGSPDSRPPTRRGMIEAVKQLKTDMQTTTAPK